MTSPRSLSLFSLVALVTGCLVGGVPSPATAALPPGCAQPVPGGLVTCTYDHTGSGQQLELPNGVTSVSITAYGGHGSLSVQGSPSPGGRGALVSGTFPVTPGDTLDVYVAGDGGHPAGGFGLGKGGTSDFDPGGLAAGGGGGSAVVDSDDVVLLVAGGGGGSGIRSNCAESGAGGDAGQDGGNGQDCGPVAGGAGGTGGGAAGPDGTSGAFRWAGGGGGGGGGYPGGGGGAGLDALNGVGAAGAGGGGGGASYADPGGTDVSLTGLSDRPLGAHGKVIVSFTIGTPAASVDVSPETLTIVLGTKQSFTTVARDTSGRSLGEVTSRTRLTIAPDGSCSADTCTPAAAGPHTVTATYGKGSAAVTGTAAVMVHEAPSFDSGEQAVFTLGDSGHFDVRVTGTPSPAIQVTAGSLPPGLSLTDNGDGTATIAGTPSGGVGSSVVGLTATNVVDEAAQDLDVVVWERPAIGPPAGDLFVVGTPTTYDVRASGFPTPTLSVDPDLPAGLTFVDHGDGTGSFTGTATGPDGTTTVTLSASNAAGSATREIPLVVATTPTGPCANVTVGTEGPDQLTGTRAGDTLRGLGGADELLGRAGDDCLRGGQAADTVRGGRDTDVLRGGLGADVLYGGTGLDLLRGGPGDDVFHLRDQQVDRVFCGAGEDRVSADRIDVLVGCERLVGPA